MMKKIQLIFLAMGFSYTLMAQSPLVNNTNVVQPDPSIVNIATDDFVFGSNTLNTAGVNTFHRFFFDKDLGAFRAGSGGAGFWDTPQLGEYSFASGLNNTASGYASFAGGAFSEARGAYSLAFSIDAEANGDRSIALGESSRANGNYAIALGHSATSTGIEALSFGFQSNATGFRSVALGGNAQANGAMSVALGQSRADGEWSLSAGLSTATGDFSASMGQGNNTQGRFSFSAGQDNITVGESSAAFGDGNQAQGFASFVANRGNVANALNSTVFGGGNTADHEYEMVIGLLNDPTNYGGFQNSPLFVVGNGLGAARDNAIAVLRNGDVVIPDLPTDLSNDPNARSVVVDPDGRLRITNGGALNTDEQTLSFNASLGQLSISNGNTVSIPDLDQQTLSLTGNILSISNGNSVTLPAGGGGIYTGGAGISIINGSIASRVTNGLRIEPSDNTIRLGGKLIENTIVSMQGYTMAFDDEGDFIVGDRQIDQTLAGNNAKMFFETASGAFRSGVVSGTQWDQSNLGGASFGAGQDVRPSGNFSFAGGHTTSAKQDWSFAFGHLSNSTGLGSISMGYRNESNGQVAVALGNGNVANGQASASIGNNNITDGLAAMALGNQNSAKGHYSIAAGLQNQSDGLTSVALGQGSVALSLGETAVGLYNTLYTPAGPQPYSWNGTDRIFVVGRGTSSVSRMDALVIHKNGNATLAGTLSQNSDKRLKKDIQVIDSASDKLSKLSGYTYHWTEEAQRSEDLQYGVIAQELQEVFPTLVTEDGEGHLAVNYNGLIPVLLEAVKEQKSALSQMQEELAVLREMIQTSTASRQNQKEDASSANAVVIYPNPAKTTLNIAGGEGITHYSLVTTEGKIIRDTANFTSEIDISNLPSGVYLLQLKSENGKIQSQKRVVVKN